MEENKQYDCSRGCSVERNYDGELECNYRAGCCKMEVYDWLKGVHQDQCNTYYEVRFKNTRKGIYVNASGQSISAGDKVVVEAVNGHDLGIVTLEGPIVLRQMEAKGFNPENFEFKKIYRKAKPLDIEKWREAVAREQETMIRARQLAANLSLEMKIGDVEFQGDGTKAIFYYIADGRVDFRQLIKDFAEEFHIRVEMKQIGARQEAGLIGGLGICGRELCCSNYIASFKSISTSAARCQDLSLNPLKLAGQCGKLKCCLNYEVAAYMDAQSRIPHLHQPLEMEDGLLYLAKTDILSGTMYFTYEKGSLSDLHPLDVSEVAEIMELNGNGQKGRSLRKNSGRVQAAEFVTSVGDDSISRFDESRRSGHRHRHGQRDSRRGGSDSGNVAAQPSEHRDGGSDRNHQRQGKGGHRHGRGKGGPANSAPKPDQSNN